MSDFTLELAAPNDDAAIRRLLANNPVAGRIAVTFEREPNYFQGCATMGRDCQVIVARDNKSEIVSVACRTARNVFINGLETRIGYLGQLRVAESHRGRWLVSRGFRFLHQLHAADPVPAYLLSIIEGNVEAAGVLIERRRAHFPSVHELGQLVTLALPLGRMKTPLFCDAEIARAQSTDLSEIVTFLRTHGARRQFYPAWTASDFSDGVTTRGFQLEDFLLARRHGELVGVIGLWDQSGYKQTVARSYSGALRWGRSLYNLAAPMLGRPRLPDIGEEIRYAYAAFTCVAGDEPEVFQALLRAAYNLAATRGHAYLMIGLEARDPLLTAAKAYPHIAYPSRLYLAYWEGDFYARLDDRIRWIEIATL